MSALLHLMSDLGKDASLAEEYQKNPEGVMKRYNLGEEEMKALASQDLEAVKKLSGTTDVHLSNGTVRSYEI